MTVRGFQRDALDPAGAAVREGALREALAGVRAAGPAAGPLAGPDDLSRALGRLGDHLRAAGRAEEAVVLLEEALAVAASPRLVATQRLRLAVARQYQGHLDDALAAFAALDADLRAAPVAGVRHFLEQHWGKCWMEAGDPERALRHLWRARRLRLRGAPSLLASTDRAIRGVWLERGISV